MENGDAASLQSFPAVSFAELADLGDAAARTLVLTVNNRHARRLLEDLAAQTRGVRQVPYILPLATWLRQAADALSDTDAHVETGAAHVLDPFAARELWAQVIAIEEPQRPLLDTRAAARLAQEADRLMVDWQLRLPEEAASLETARFGAWRRAYLARLHALDAHDDARLIETVLAAAAHGTLPLSCDTVVLAGFGACSPAVHTLLQHLQRQGRHVLTLAAAPEQATRAVRCAAPTPQAEWRAACAWAAHCVRAHAGGRFAIVAAQLEADMPFAHRVLRAALGDTPYNMAVARPLAAWPLVGAALAWLRLLTAYGSNSADAAAGVEPALVGAALLAGACAQDTREANARAALDARWRHQGVLRIPYPILVQHLTQNAPGLAHAWQDAWVCAHKTRSARATLDVWIARFGEELQRLGFPGDARDSVAHQTLQAFETALARAAAHSFAFGRLSRREALGMFERMLAQTRFQPMRDPSARVDVLGLLEAEGGRWDGVWVLGLHDTVFPAAPRPNPLLPLALLRASGAPRTTQVRELQWAEATRAFLLACAARVLFSHAQQQGEEPLRASPLLTHLTEIPLDQAACDAWTDTGCSARQLPAPAGAASQTVPGLETLLDAQGPALAASGKPLRGGIGVIDAQARNPLWAFVKYRLGARLLPDYARADDARARGNFLHHALELVWRLLPDQAALLHAWDKGRLPALIEQAVAHAAEQHLQDVSPTLKRLEMARATDVLHQSLALERTRAPFRIEALEQSRYWRAGALELRVRLDRVDALADGSLMVMDYKTGAHIPQVRGDWMRARPVNVQLPFYAAMLAHAPREVSALALLRVHARGVEWRGIAHNPDIKGIDRAEEWPLFATLCWDDVMHYWRSALQAIAREVATGVAENIVRHTADVQYCDVLPFLRLNETITPGVPHVPR